MRRPATVLVAGIRISPVHCDHEDVNACLEIKPSGINDTGSLSVFSRIIRGRAVAVCF